MRSLTLAGRLTIIGDGVMGLMTAYYAAPPEGVAS
jgi:NADPH-dependent 2,4-dienoyl-CoA reductase/sulfur reductase-like enzyme